MGRKASSTGRKTNATWGSCPARASQSASYQRHLHPPHRAAPMTRSCRQQIWGEGVYSETTRTIHLSFKGRVGSPCHIRVRPTLVASRQPLAAAAANRLIARGAQPPVRNNQLAAALKCGWLRFNWRALVTVLLFVSALACATLLACSCVRDANLDDDFTHDLTVI